MEGKNQLKVLNLQMTDMARQVENAIQFGNPVLLQDVLEEIDPILEPVLSKSFIKRGNQVRTACCLLPCWPSHMLIFLAGAIMLLPIFLSLLG